MATQKTAESTYVFLNLKDNTLDVVDKACHTGVPIHLGPPCHDLGALEELPLEIIHMVLIQLDMASLAEFQQTNKRAREVVTSTPPYKQILLHAPVLIRATINIATAPHITCQELYDKLCTATCDTCGDFGGYLYLMTCRRVCYLCFTQEEDFLPLKRTEVIRKFELRTEDLQTLPTMRSFPGCYTTREIMYRRREVLYDHRAAQQLGITVHGSVDAMQEAALDHLARRLTLYASRRSRSDTSGINLCAPKLVDHFDGHSSNPRRFMSIVRAPVLDRVSSSLEWGSHCVACRGYYNGRPLHWRRMYSIQSFQDHIRECGEIVDGEHHHIERQE